MKTIKAMSILPFITMIIVCIFPSTASAAELEGGGILYGSQYGYLIQAPKGWMFDNESAVDEGLYCVMYPKGTTWEDNPVYIYAAIYATDGKDLEKYIDDDIAQLAKKHSTIVKKYKKFTAGKRYPAMVVDFSLPAKSHYERICYVWSGESLCMIVMSTGDPAYLKKYPNQVVEIANNLFLMSVKDETQKK